jgi:hypothetical protein
MVPKLEKDRILVVRTQVKAGAFCNSIEYFVASMSGAAKSHLAAWHCACFARVFLDPTSSAEL